MNTQNNFYTNTKKKFGLENENNFNPPRIKTSSSPSRTTLLKDFGSNKKNGIIMPSIVSNYNIQNLKIMDPEKLRDELIKCKNELKIRNKEFLTLKINYVKLDGENKRNTKIIEEVLDVASKNKNVDFNDKNQDYESQVKNILGNTFMSINDMNRLKEKQLLDYKMLTNSKDEEILLLKNNSKVIKYHEIEIKLRNTIEEYENLTEKFNLIKIGLNDKDSKLKDMTDERDYYKAMMIRIKAQFDDSKEKLQYYQDQTSKLGEINKMLENKHSLSKFQNKTINFQLKEKDLEINKLKEERGTLDKTDVEKKEKNIINLNKTIQSLKDDLERKNRKIKEIEKSNSDLKEKFENLTAQNKKLSTNINSSYNTGKKEKENRIKKLEEENLKLKEEIKKFIQNVEVKGNSLIDSKIYIGENYESKTEEVINNEENKKSDTNVFYTLPKEVEKSSFIEKKITEHEESNIKHNERYDEFENKESKEEENESNQEKSNVVFKKTAGNYPENTENSDDANYDNAFEKIDDNNNKN